jgi:multidrug efflux pump subunit AcrA (membrane-fusion protein)
MKTDLKSQEARLELSKVSLKRIGDLFEKKMVPKSDYDEIKTASIVAELEVLRAKEAQQLAQLELERAIEVLKLRSITSPIDGVVVERFKSPGEYVEDEPILKLAQTNLLNIEVILPLAWRGQIKLGSKAKVFPEKPVGGVFTAKVKIIDSVIDAASGTFGIRLELPNHRYRVPAGLKCDIEFSKN